MHKIFILLQNIRMKTIKINGVTYQFKKFDSCHNGVTDIYSLYKKPSYEKISAYNYRKEKLDCIYGMKGNSNCFSIYWYVIDEDWIERDVKITRFNNYILDGRRM